MATEDQQCDEKSELGVIEAPHEAPGVAVADPVENTIGFFPYAVLEPIGGEHGNEGERKDERADESEGHGVGHGMEEFAGGPGERVDGKITGDDDGDGVKDGAVDVASGGEDDFVEFVFLAVAFGKLAVNVLDHDDGAVDDDAEVDGADGEQVGGLAGGVQKDESEQERQRNGEGGDDGGADADEEEEQHKENQDHAAEKISFHGVGGDADEVAAIVVGADFDVRRQDSCD